MATPKLTYSNLDELNQRGDKNATKAGYRYGQGLLQAYQEAQPGLVNQSTSLLTQTIPQISGALSAADQLTWANRQQFLTDAQGRQLPGALAREQRILVDGTKDTGRMKNFLVGEALNAGPNAISQQLKQQALEELRLGGTLSPDQARTADQAARGAWADRGLQFSNPALIGEVLNREAAQQMRLRERQGFAGGVNSQLLSEQAMNRGFQTDVGRLQLARQQLLGAQASQLVNDRARTNPAYLAMQQNSPAPGVATSLLQNSNQTGLAMTGLQDAYTGFLMNRSQSNQIAELNRRAGVQSGQMAADAAGAAGDKALAGAGIAAAGVIAAAFLICWVAREVYGETDGRWMRFRQWMLHMAPLRRRHRYCLHGPKIAAWLRQHPDYKPRVRRWMERCIHELEHSRVAA